METSPDRPPPSTPTGPPPDIPVAARPPIRTPGGNGGRGSAGHGAGRRRPGRRRRDAARHALRTPPVLAAVAGSPEEPARRRTTLVALGVVAAASAAALVAGLLSWAPAPGEPARALTAAEAERLAATRVTNLRDVRAGVRMTVGTGAARTDLVGWIDWARPLAYLDVGGPGAGADRGLVQATPSVVVLRPDPAAVPTPASPPLVPPTDRWRLRDLPAGRPLAGALEVLFGLSADRAEPADPLRHGAGRWVGRETLAGEPVDVLQAPLPRPTAAADPTARPPAPPAAGDGDPRWWVDGDSRLHRWKGRLPGGQPAAVELERNDRPTIWPVDALGGRPGLPRALTDTEAERLARLPARLRAQPGAAVTIAVPLGTAANLRGSGWLSWSGGVAYLSVAELDTLGRRTLLRRDRDGFARAEVPVGPGAGATGAANGPPLPPPAGAGWRTGARPLDDLDLLIDAALRADTAPGRPAAAVRLRADRVAGRVVDVVELRVQGLRLRYWLDRTGLPRRLELRTRAGAWAQLDLTPAPVPAGIVPPRPGPTAAKAPAARAGTAGRR
ncbi:hypothetical protein GA0074696_2447 [Micromonospora purpureochromogenes]|uniref:Uncharacterized protein n=1 Tax=Micromonospora purpureochromogenes TaxID=47872 RepID=A0A1C4XA96_9ACTN|nr:hypothetical protein [Micromonospora purpureochromogenes]SCF05352.1 hypothetical protein GA0074696_2447 [Micromonospora purpureochromogenes]